MHHPHAQPGCPDSHSKRVSTLYPSSLTGTPPPSLPPRSDPLLRSAPAFRAALLTGCLAATASSTRDRPKFTMAGGAGRAGLRRSGPRGRAEAGPGGRPAPRGGGGGAWSALQSPGSVTLDAGLAARAPPGPRLGHPPPYIQTRRRVRIIESINCCGGRFA